jgi:hypothetical protein
MPFEAVREIDEDRTSPYYYCTVREGMLWSTIVGRFTTYSRATARILIFN